MSVRSTGEFFLLSVRKREREGRGVASDESSPSSSVFLARSSSYDRPHNVKLSRSYEGECSSRSLPEAGGQFDGTEGEREEEGRPAKVLGDLLLAFVLAVTSAKLSDMNLQQTISLSSLLPLRHWYTVP